MTAAANSPAEDATLEDVLNRAVGSHPAPSAIAAELMAEAEREHMTPAHQVTSAQRVALPDGFDPLVHEYPPHKTARGTWRKLRKGQKNNLEQLEAAQAPAAADQDGGGDPDRAAENLAGTFFAIAPAVLGKQWAPTDDERTMVTDALARYYRANGSIDVPPGIGLILAVGAYAAPRAMTLPPVKKLVDQVAAKLFGDGVAADPADAQAQSAPLVAPISFPPPPSTLYAGSTPDQVRDAA